MSVQGIGLEHGARAAGDRRSQHASVRVGQLGALKRDMRGEDTWVRCPPPACLYIQPLLRFRVCGYNPSLARRCLLVEYVADAQVFGQLLKRHHLSRHSANPSHGRPRSPPRRDVHSVSRAVRKQTPRTRRT